MQPLDFCPYLPDFLVEECSTVDPGLDSVLSACTDADAEEADTKAGEAKTDAEESLADAQKVLDELIDLLDIWNFVDERDLLHRICGPHVKSGCAHASITPSRLDKVFLLQ